MPMFPSILILPIMNAVTGLASRFASATAVS